MKKIISGAGGGGGKGGGGGGYTPSEASNSLQSKAFAQIIDLVSEGEIEGLNDGMKSIYLDGTPVQNADGSYNFTGLSFQSRNGVQNQDYIPGFSAAENEIIVSTEFRQDTPVVRTINNSSVDAIRVRISLPQLTYQNPNNGDLSGSTVQFAIDLQSNGAGFQEVANDTIIGKSTSKYEKKYRIELTGDPPWDIRLRRVTADSDSVSLQNKTIWESFTQVVDGKLTYPNSALVALRVDSSQFNSIPTRGYDLKLLRIKVPTNYNPVSRTYTGSWDGSFYIAWTDNPAWIFYDMITSERYGLGAFIPESHVDIWSLYTIAKYCDEMVSDGFGGIEPRFTCNVYLQSREQAFKIIQDLASCFRAMAYWAGGVITLSQDSPTDAAHLFSAANVVGGQFNYSGSSSKTRHTVALVSWNDPTDFYKQKVEYVEDAQAVSRFGIVETQVVAFGCTSRGQAHRVGKWILFTEQNQTEILSFKTGLNGATCRPGQIIKVADQNRAGSRLSGRVYDSTTSSITVDQDLDIDPITHTLAVALPNGEIEQRSLTTASGNQLNIVGEFSEAPQKNAMWMLASNIINPQLFKIISIMESEDGSYAISAIAHNPQKYDYIENSLILEPRSISILRAIPDPPIGVLITETLYDVKAELRVKATISWNPSINATSYIVQYSRDNLNPITLPQTTSNDIEILNAEPGVYSISVVAISPFGVKSGPAIATKKILGKTQPPGNVTGFSLIPSNGIAYLSWDSSVDLDVLIGGTVRIRYSPNIVDPVWKNSVDICPALPGNSTRVQAPLLTGCYMIKFVDSSYIASNEEALIVTTSPSAQALNIIETITESPAFLGVKTNMEYIAFYSGLALKASLSIDEVTDLVDSIVNWDFAGGVAAAGVYDFENVHDLGNVFTSRVTAYIDAEAVDVTDTIDQRIEEIDDWSDLDGAFIDDVNAELFLQTTLDDPLDIGAVWTEWKRFFVGEYTARGYKFQLRAVSGQQSHNIIIKNLSVAIDVPDRDLNMLGLISGTSSYDVIFDEAFLSTPFIGITALGMSTGDYHRVTSESRTGFTITFYNASDTIISRTFNVFAKGVGRQQ